MNHLDYCPKCGQKSLTWNEINKWECPECKFVLFHNCAGAVAVVIKHGDEILLTRRNQEPGKGKLDLAGGFVDPKESAEETCARELFEELKIRIDPSKLRILLTLPNVYHYKGIDYNTLDIFFEYEVQEKFRPEIAEDELSEILWMKKDEIQLEDIAFDSQRKFFAKYLAQ